MRYDAWFRYSLGKEVLLAFTLTLAVVFDYLTGSVAALRTGAWSSRAACDGLWRKAGIMAGVLLAALMDFASRLLAPACVLWGCGVRSAEDIERLCDISRAAAEFRWSRMQELYRRQRFLTSPLERLVYAQFEDYIKGHRLRGVGQ